MKDAILRHVRTIFQQLMKFKFNFKNFHLSSKTFYIFTTEKIHIWYNNIQNSHWK